MTELSVREKNWIISAVNCRKTPEEAGLKTEAELAYYKMIWLTTRQEWYIIILYYFYLREVKLWLRTYPKYSDVWYLMKM